MLISLLAVNARPEGPRTQAYILSRSSAGMSRRRLRDEMGADVAEAVDLDVSSWSRFEMSSTQARFVHVEFIVASKLARNRVCLSLRLGSSLRMIDDGNRIEVVRRSDIRCVVAVSLVVGADFPIMSRLS